MKRAVLFFAIAATVFVGVLAARIIKPPNLSSNDPTVRALEERHRQLAGFAQAIAEMEVKSARVQSAIWTPKALDQFVSELPKGWVARPLTADTKLGITLQRYAFSKDVATLRDYPEFQRVLKRLEERPSTRIDTVTLTVNPDGKRFSSALITATIPVSKTQ